MLSPHDVADIEHGLAQIEQTNIPIPAIKRDDFPLGDLAGKIKSVSDNLRVGLGVALIRGLPIDRYSQEQAERIFFALGTHFGHPIVQNARGHWLGHVKDEGRNLGEPGARGYQTNAALSLHSDRFSDIVGLMCWRQAAAGGDSVVVSSGYLFEQLAADRPELSRLLFEPWPWMERDEVPPGQSAGIEMSPLCEEVAGEYQFRLNRAVLEKTQERSDAPALTPAQSEALAVMDRIAERPGVALRMRLEPGDIQLLNNYQTVHGRGEFSRESEGDHKSTDPRHLFRLWIRWDGAGRPTWAHQLPYQWIYDVARGSRDQ